MMWNRTARDGPSLDEVSDRGSLLPAFALFVDGPAWLNTTVTALLAVGLLTILAWALLHAARRFRWIDRGRDIQIKRSLRVVLGGLVLAAMTLPYLTVEMPMVAASIVICSLLVTIPYLATLPTGRTPSEHSTGEYPDVEA